MLESWGSNMKNKQILITGGANGIGRGIAQAFLEKGAEVIIVDIDKDTGQEFAQGHENLHFFYGDIAEKKVLEDLVQSLKKPIDCIINNACLSKEGILTGCSYEDFEYVQKIGVTAPYYLANLLFNKYLLGKKSSMVNIASTRAKQSQANTESYSAAKGGILALTHALAVSLAGITRVNAISPGWIETSFDPRHSLEDQVQHLAGRVGTVQDIVEMVLFLCSDKSEFITGENITIDGGMSRLMIYHNDNGWKLENLD